MTAQATVAPHFPDLSEEQLEQLDLLAQGVKEWNQRINVISRKDEHVMERHVLHSLGIAKVLRFAPGSHVLDVGTGGGFPGLPLAVMHPDTSFVLCDSIGKKIKVVRELAKTLQLQNVQAVHARAEDVEGSFDFVVSRAVTRMGQFLPWVEGKLAPASNHNLPNGILYLKGGDLQEELDEVRQPCTVHPLAEWFPAPFFETKAVVHVALT